MKNKAGCASHVYMSQYSQNDCETKSPRECDGVREVRVGAKSSSVGKTQVFFFDQIFFFTVNKNLTFVKKSHVEVLGVVIVT